MPTMSINGVQLYVEQTGKRGRPLLLVHGSWGDRHNWDAVVPALSKSFRVVTCAALIRGIVYWLVGRAGTV